MQLAYTAVTVYVCMCQAGFHAACVAQGAACWRAEKCKVPSIATHAYLPVADTIKFFPGVGGSLLSKRIPNEGSRQLVTAL